MASKTAKWALYIALGTAGAFVLHMLGIIHEKMGACASNCTCGCQQGMTCTCH